MKLDLNVCVDNGAGLTLKENGQDMILGKILAAALHFSEEKANAVKFYDWGFELNNIGVITVDNADYTTLLNFIESGSFRVLVRAQLIKRLQDCKAKKEEKQIDA